MGQELVLLNYFSLCRPFTSAKTHTTPLKDSSQVTFTYDFSQCISVGRRDVPPAVLERNERAVDMTSKIHCHSLPAGFAYGEGQSMCDDKMVGCSYGHFYQVSTSTQKATLTTPRGADVSIGLFEATLNKVAEFAGKLGTPSVETYLLVCKTGLVAKYNLLFVGDKSNQAVSASTFENKCNEMGNTTSYNIFGTYTLQSIVKLPTKHSYTCSVPEFYDNQMQVFASISAGFAKCHFTVPLVASNGLRADMKFLFPPGLAFTFSPGFSIGNAVHGGMGGALGNCNTCGSINMIVFYVRRQCGPSRSY